MKRLVKVFGFGLVICLMWGAVSAYAEEEPTFVLSDQNLSMSAGIFDWTGVKEAVAGAVESFIQTAKDIVPFDILSPVAEPDREPVQYQIAWTNPDNAQYESQLEKFRLPHNIATLSLQEQVNFLKDEAYNFGTEENYIHSFGDTYTQWVRGTLPDGESTEYKGDQWGANVWNFEYDAQGRLDAVKISVQSYHYSPEEGDQFSVIAEIITRREPATL